MKKQKVESKQTDGLNKAEEASKVARRDSDVIFYESLSQLLIEAAWTPTDLVRHSQRVCGIGPFNSDNVLNSKNGESTIEGQTKVAISQSKLTKWKAHTLRPTEDEIVAVGTSLYYRFKELKREGSSAGRSGEYWNICSLLNQLLNAAGYAMLDSGRMNQTWNTITRRDDDVKREDARRIFFGWTHLQYYCNGKNDGFAFDLGDTVARMLNFDPVWIEFPFKASVFEEMINDLRLGAIDAIGPFLFHIPSREVDLIFTDSIGFMERFVVIAGSRQLTNALQRFQVQRDGNHHLLFLRGDASEVMGRILLPTSISTSFGDEDNLLMSMTTPTDSEGRLKCFVTGAIDAERIMKSPAYKNFLVVGDIHQALEHSAKSDKYTFHLPTSFAVRDTEPRLAHAINNCLRILKNNGYIYQYLKDRYKDKFNNKVMWEDELDKELKQSVAAKNKTKRH